MNPNEIRNREACEWMEKALDDLESARVLAAVNRLTRFESRLGSPISKPQVGFETEYWWRPIIGDRRDPSEESAEIG